MTGKHRIILIANPEKAEAVAAGREFYDRLRGRIEVVEDNFERACDLHALPDADYLVVFGGDGSILSTVRAMGERQIPIIGVNMGKLGFMAEFALEELMASFDMITSHPKPYKSRVMLHCRIEGPNREVFESKVVNEVALTAGPPFRMIEISISIADEHLACCAGDGLIVSTPTGSTAYNLSAGGPILESSLQAAVITPLAAHSLSFRPIVVNLADPICLQSHDVRRHGGVREPYGVVVVIDGQEHTVITPEDRVTITESPNRFMLVNNRKQSQWRLLSAKLNWGILPNYVSNGERNK